MFAVFKTGGKQYRVAAEDMLQVDKIKGEPGEIVEFGEVLVVGGDSVTLGAPTVAGATVAAEVVVQGRGAKIIAFKKRRRKNSRRKRGFRQEFTLLRITEILTSPARPCRPGRSAPRRPSRLQLRPKPRLRRRPKAPQRESRKRGQKHPPIRRKSPPPRKRQRSDPKR
jgi:large subunit ribosomal protein L21